MDHTNIYRVIRVIKGYSGYSGYSRSDPRLGRDRLVSPVRDRSSTAAARGCLEEGPGWLRRAGRPGKTRWGGWRDSAHNGYCQRAANRALHTQHTHQARGCPRVH